MLDLQEGVLEEFAERAARDVDIKENSGFYLLQKSRAKPLCEHKRPGPVPKAKPVATPKPPKRELSLEEKRARYRAESKAKRARVTAEIRALRAARACSTGTGATRSSAQP